MIEKIWISVDEELPEKDGEYFVTNHPELEVEKCIEISEYYFTYSEYDGHGFKKDGNYINPKFWKKIILPPKRYGKIEKSPH